MPIKLSDLAQEGVGTAYIYQIHTVEQLGLQTGSQFLDRCFCQGRELTSGFSMWTGNHQCNWGESRKDPEKRYEGKHPDDNWIEDDIWSREALKFLYAWFPMVWLSI